MSSPTEMEQCIKSLISVFQGYAWRDGNNCKLSKTEFLTFLSTELAAFTKNQKGPGVLDHMMKKLDINSDGQLDFQEFLNLIGSLAWVLFKVYPLPEVNLRGALGPGLQTTSFPSKQSPSHHILITSYMNLGPRASTTPFGSVLQVVNKAMAFFKPIKNPKNQKTKKSYIKYHIL